MPTTPVAVSKMLFMPASDAMFTVYVAAFGSAFQTKGPLAAGSPFTGATKETCAGEAKIVSVNGKLFGPLALLEFKLKAYSPGATEPVFVIDKVLVPAGVTGFVPKDDPRPGGRPETLNVTLEE